jgi:hypothetical protein
MPTLCSLNKMVKNYRLNISGSKLFPAVSKIIGDPMAEFHEENKETLIELYSSNNQMGLQINMPKTIVMTDRGKTPIQTGKDKMYYCKQYISLRQTVSLTTTFRKKQK